MIFTIMIRQTRQINVLAIALLIIGLGLAMPVMAQDDDTGNRPTPYAERLGFELNEDRIKAYVIAGEAIRRINREYDMLISAAPTKEKALEVIASSQQFIDKSFEQIGNINRQQYAAIYDLSLDDPFLAQVIQILKRDMFPDG